MGATPSEQKSEIQKIIPSQGLVPEFFLQLHITRRLQGGFLKHPCLLLQRGLRYDLLAGIREIFILSLLRSFMMSLV